MMYTTLIGNGLIIALPSAMIWVKLKLMEVWGWPF
jgi:hypothetical protein